MADERSTEQLERDALVVEGCRLVVLEGVDRGAQLEVAAGAVIVGSDAGADLQLRDSAVSGRHLEVRVGSAGVEVADLGSTNGTFYLSTRIERAVVSPGAVLTIGRTRLAVRSREPAGDVPNRRDSYGALIGSSPAMRRLYAVLERLERSDHTVLIEGETGVGKELVAREIHRGSRRSGAPFEVLDCGSVPEQLAESELFGHVRGAFTGAVDSHQGVFARAGAGTVFLDEIGELPLALQPKLLRVLESRELRPVGGSQMKKVQARVVAATNRSLAEEVRAGRFREDLYFRLKVVTVRVPPLRERRECIPELVRHVVSEMGHPELTLAPETIELFTSSYDWPGNVRELRNAIASVLSLGTLPDDIAPKDGAPASAEVDLDEPFLRARKRLLDAFEHDYLKNQLERAEHNLARAARLSGMDRSYFKRLLKRNGLLGGAKE